MTSAPASKRARTNPSSSPSPPYELYYWPTLPGRGESIRLCFEATSTPYTDVTNTTPKEGMSTLKSLIAQSPSSTANPPNFAPPILKHGDLTISQQPNILLYLGPRLGLAPSESEDPTAIYHINQFALTALDGLSNEPHETHHPISVGAYYEDQKEAAKTRAKDYRENRLPKFLTYFENVLSSESSKGGEYLYGGQLSYADLVLFQCLDGVSFAFPKAVERTRTTGTYEKTWGLYERIKGMEEIKEYLGSKRRMSYGNGIWRYYEELDDQ